MTCLNQASKIIWERRWPDSAGWVPSLCSSIYSVCSQTGRILYINLTPQYILYAQRWAGYPQEINCLAWQTYPRAEYASRMGEAVNKIESKSASILTASARDLYSSARPSTLRSSMLLQSIRSIFGRLVVSKFLSAWVVRMPRRFSWYVVNMPTGPVSYCSAWCTPLSVILSQLWYGTWLVEAMI